MEEVHFVWLSLPALESNSSTINKQYYDDDYEQ